MNYEGCRICYGKSFERFGVWCLVFGVVWYVISNEVK